MLTWISEQAKWVIYTFIVFIVIGLLFMDNNSLGSQKIPPVATANGEEVSYAEYRNRLDMREQQLAGRNLSNADRAKLREEVLKEIVQRRQYEKVVETHGFYASKAEMYEDLMNNPPEAWKNQPLFQTDSVFDMNKWKNWLQNDSIYEMPAFRGYESFLRLEKIPQQQIQVFLSALNHPTELEAKFMIGRRDTRYKLQLAKVSLDSFKLPENYVTDERIKEFFEANPDSFVVTEDVADYKAIVLKQAPGPIDEEHALKFSNYILNQAKEGVDFAELAKENSEDQGSAIQGGALGEEYMPAATYVPEFSKAAFALDSGAISEPVKTQFGYHIIKSHGKIVEEGVEKAKLSHILIKVSVGTETMDSLQTLLEGVYKEISENGKSLEEAAKAQNLKVEDVKRVAKGGDFGGMGFFSGLESYTWHDDKDQLVSKVLQNDKYFIIAQKIGTLEKGKRDLETFRNSISNSVVREYKLAEAKKHLKENWANVEAGNLTDTKVVLDSTQWVSLDSYIGGIGFANANAGVIAKTEIGAWTDVFAGERNAVAAKVLEKTAPNADQVAALVGSELNRQRQTQGQVFFGDWTELLFKQADFENKLYLHYEQ